MSRIYRQEPCWTERTIDTTHLRAAAGACALSIGLLVCSSGGAIATADQTGTADSPADTQDSSTNTDGTNNTSSSSTDPTSTFGNQRTDTEEESEESLTTTITTIATGTISAVTGGTGPTSVVQAQTNTSVNEPEATATQIEQTQAEATGTSAANVPVTESIAPLVETIMETIAPSTESSSAPGATTAPAAANQNGESGTTPTSANAPTPSTPGSVAPKPSVNAAVFQPVTNAINTLARALGEAGLTLASLPSSQNPFGDVITAIQVMINAVVDAVVEVAQVPGNLLNLLGFATADGPRAPLFGASGSTGTVSGAPVGAPLFGNEGMQQSQVVALDAPLFGSVVNASEFGGVAPASLSHGLSLSGLAPAPSGVNPATSSFLDNVVKSVLVPASLTALAAIAIPGIGGLLIVCAAGIRVGYRQAKASLALRMSGIARFAGPGPMGVVRSGSLITLHHPRTKRIVEKPRATHAVRARTAGETRVLERVA